MDSENKTSEQFEYKIVIEFDSSEKQKQAYAIYSGLKAQQINDETVELDTNSYQDWRGTDIIIERLLKRKLGMGGLPKIADDELVTSEYLGHGIIKLFKSGSDFDQEKEKGNSDIITAPADDTMVSILFPTYFTVHDLLHNYIGDSIVYNQVSDFRILRNKQKGIGFNFMVLMKFREASAAKKFKDEFNGKRFSKMDPETCNVVFIKEVIFAKKLFPRNEKKQFPYLLNDPFTTVRDSEKNSVDIELPTCPVCLERMDSETTGLITIPCQHTFHCQCLDKWKNSKCPVCRLSSVRLSRDTLKTQSKHEKCYECGSSENLWICLICGHVGCGRYSSRHAIKHFEETAHCFAMDYKTDRVWDYAGDNYVHRLVENEVDGKLVELGESSEDRSNSRGSNAVVKKMGSKSEEDEKDLRVNFMRNREYHLEYVQVLISQLESQSEYYEMKMQDTSKLQSEIEKLTEELKESHLQNQILNDNNKKVKTEVKISNDKQKQLQADLEESQLLIRGLQENLSHKDEKIEELEIRMKKQEESNKDLQDQIRDLMFYLESRDKFDNAPDDVKEGTILVQSGESKGKKKKKPKKKVPKIPKLVLRPDNESEQ
ncbi:hypothetical protein RNJ44_02296 [Nakaseomyces bracarensis]|uniref:Uncharacterized protein n=1 Tax=Nakaseomyces bracarensis TaxID=273131 RepID=A0ABR4NNA0_9SACH